MPIVQLSFFDGKVCCRCQQWLPLNSFYVNKHRTSGRHPWCKACKKAYDQDKKATWAENGRRRIQAEGGRKCPNCGIWKAVDAFGVNAGDTLGIQRHCNECRSQYREENRNLIRSQKNVRYWEAPDKHRMQKRNDHNKHREERNTKRLEYRRLHLGKELERTRKWFRDNPERVRWHGRMGQHRRRAWKQMGGGSVRLRDWHAMCVWFGNSCLCCGIPTELTMDHVVPLARGGKHAIENMQPLCRRCNQHKFTKSTDYRDPALLAAFLATL